jgi:DNA-binding SARP family transcriptional activator
MQADRRAEAIAELERWVGSHPSDSDMLLSLARLLSEAGRSNDAIGRYRQILSLRPRGE